MKEGAARRALITDHPSSITESSLASRRHPDAVLVLFAAFADVADDQDDAEEDERHRPAPAIHERPVDVDVAVDEPEGAQADEDDAPGQSRRALRRLAQLSLWGEAALDRPPLVDGSGLPDGVDDSEEPEKGRGQAEERLHPAVAVEDA